MYKIVTNQKGAGLLYILFFSMFLTIITLPLVQGSVFAINNSLNTIDKLTVSNAVSEAYEMEVQTILTTDPDAHGGLGGTTTRTINGVTVSVDVTVNSTPAAYTDQEGDIEVAAEATLDDVTSRLQSRFTYLNLANYALFTAGSGGNVTIRNGAVRTNATVYPRIDASLADFTYVGDQSIGFNWPAGYRQCSGMWVNSWIYSFLLGWNNPMLVSEDGLSIDLTTAAGSGFWANLQQFANMLLNVFGVSGTMTVMVADSGGDVFMNNPGSFWGSTVNYFGYNGSLFSRADITGVPPYSTEWFKLFGFIPLFQYPAYGLEVNLTAAQRADLISYFQDYSYNGGPSLITSTDVQRW